jgi:uncharacterized protein (DUF1810 family)
MDAKQSDLYDLGRFVKAQEDIFESVLTELTNGQKRSHWMWFIFPQIEGLGRSPTSKYYSIKSREEAQEYLSHPILGTRLLRCAELLLSVDGRSAMEIFGPPDDQKLKASMTLFATVADSGSIFERVLKKYFDGERDNKTIALLSDLSQ